MSISHVENFHKLNNLLDIVFKEEEFWQIKLRGILYISLALIVFWKRFLLNVRAAEF